MEKNYRMAVTVTLVFSDESHREAWLEQEGFVGLAAPAEDGPWPEDPIELRLALRRADYDRRRQNTDLHYEVGPVTRRHST